MTHTPKKLNRYVSRTLYWDGSQGMASIRLVVLPLVKPPRVNGQLVEQIDYAPMIGAVCILEAAANAWRDLLPDEQDTLDQRLQAMLDAGLAVWE